MAEGRRLIVCVPKPRHAHHLTPIVGQLAGRQMGGAEIAFGDPESGRGEYDRHEDSAAFVLNHCRRGEKNVDQTIRRA